MSGPIVPYTPILRRYKEVCDLDDARRFDLAQKLNREPGLLAADFSATVAALEVGYDSQASFRPKHNEPRVPAQQGIANGPDLAWYMYRQGKLEVENEPALAVEYAEYELSVLSTRGGAVFDAPVHGATERNERPGSAGNPLKADLVLVNADPADRMPVLAEVKVKRDKEPFSALVQLLAYIAHLASPSQYARLRAHLDGAGFPAANPARFDGYLLSTSSERAQTRGSTSCSWRASA